MLNDQTILFHVGLHKTGTTWVQQQLFQKGNGTHFRYSEDRTLLRGLFSVPEYGMFDPGQARAALAQGLTGDADQPIVLSDELLAGLPFHNPFVQGITMERIAQTFPQAKILITIREQISLIHSAYGHYLRGGHTGSLDDFLAEPDGKHALLWRPIFNRDYYDYDRLHGLYAARFGAENVMVAPMEWMIGDTPAFLGRLRDLTGHSWPDAPVASQQKRVNIAWSDLARGYVRFANRFEDKDARWSKTRGRFSKNAIASKISRATPKPMRDRMKAEALGKITAAMGGRYAPSNAALGRKISIDLARYGYDHSEQA